MVGRTLLAALVAFLPSVALAQGRGMMAPMAHPVPHPAAAAPRVAPQVATHIPRPVVGQPTAGARPVVRSGAARSHEGIRAARNTRRDINPQRNISPRRRFDDCIDSASDFPVPGLGFDVPHLAATRGSGAVGACGRGVPLFFPFFDGGFFLPNTPASVEESAAEAQPAETPEAEAAPRAPRSKGSQLAAAPAAEPAAAAPKETEEEFVFVRRDGTVFFAVAFAWENGTLRYVTPEGLRRAVPRETLDLGATQQFNEQR